MWKETRDLSKELNAGITVFMSGVHFIPESLLRVHYDPPGPEFGPGTSAIKKILNSQKDTIPLRVEQVEAAMSEGHIDIGSHAVGHFDGGNGPKGLHWSTDDWVSELTQFQDIVVNVFDINKIPERFPGENAQWKSKLTESLRGFRAPLLAAHPWALQPALVKMGYTFDGSETAPMGKWPYYKSGILEIPMGVIPIVGTAKKSISIDYNFYAYDSSAKPDLANSHRFQQRWIDSLMNYFNHSYYGNRAPVHVGAHFDDWNGRAYFAGFFQFARKVCRLPEVECVTGKELLGIIKTMGVDRVRQYEAGEFEQLPRPETLPSAEAIDMKVAWESSPEGIRLAMVGDDVARLSSQLSFEVLVNNVKVSNQLGMVRLTGAPSMNASGLSEVKVRIMRGADELLTSTRRLQSERGMLRQIEVDDREMRFLKGDLPGAHGEPDDEYDELVLEPVTSQK